MIRAGTIIAFCFSTAIFDFRLMIGKCKQRDRVLRVVALILKRYSHGPTLFSLITNKFFVDSVNKHRDLQRLFRPIDLQSFRLKVVKAVKVLPDKTTNAIECMVIES
jgi:hypothetical protein